MVSLGRIKRCFQSGPAYSECAYIVSAFSRSFGRTVVAARAGGRVVRMELPLLQRAVSLVIIRSISSVIPPVSWRKVIFCDGGSQLLRLGIAMLCLYTVWRVRICILTSIVTSLISGFVGLDLESVCSLRSSCWSEKTSVIGRHRNGCASVGSTNCK
jgi:hypothetical protein